MDWANILQIIGLGLTAALLAALLRQTKFEAGALIVALIAGIVIFLVVFTKISLVVQVLQDMSRKAGINEFYLGLLFKIVGIAYLTEFGAQLCRDAGESAIAGRVELAGKVLIIIVAVPILIAILELIVRLLP
ncbi:MAG: stage III sporulation protein AD [Clostridia bacterium]|nr:stage III sporulation protein AD [Clostridia bacterium]